MLVLSQLRGFNLRASGSAAITSLTFVSSAAGTTSSLSFTAGAAGDFAIVIDSAGNTSGAPSAIGSAGWTTVDNQTIGTIRTIISCKTLDGTETSYAGMNGTSVNNKAIVIVRPDGTILLSDSTIATDAENRLLGLTSAAAIAAGSTYANSTLAPAVAIGYLSSTGTSTGSGTFTSTGSNFQNAARGKAWYNIQNGTQTALTIGASDGGTSNMIGATSFYIN